MEFTAELVAWHANVRACMYFLLPCRAVAFDDGFPYCRCLDYSSVSTPYTVVLKSVNTTAVSLTANFELRLNNVLPALPSTCFSEIQTNGVPKIEFATSRCHAPLRVHAHTSAYPHQRRHAFWPRTHA